MTKRGFQVEIGPLVPPPPWPPPTMDMTFCLWMRPGQAFHHLRPHWCSRWDSILKRLWYNTSKEKHEVPTCQEEAVIQLEATCAQSKVKQVKHLLALCMAKECEILGQLYHLQAECVVKQLDVVKEELGTIQDTLCQSSLQIVTWTPYSSSSQSQLSGKHKVSYSC